EAAQKSITLPSPPLDPSFGGLKSSSIVVVLRAKQKAIYGVDDRQEIADVTDPAIRDDADTVVSLFFSRSVTENGDGTCTLQTKPFGAALGLCPGERYYDQPSGAFGSGFLVGRDVIATAGHCVDEYRVTDVRFVYGFRMLDS